jgi:hypothetical protein
MCHPPPPPLDADGRDFTTTTHTNLAGAGTSTLGMFIAQVDANRKFWRRVEMMEKEYQKALLA